MEGWRDGGERRDGGRGEMEGGERSERVPVHTSVHTARGSRDSHRRARA